MWIYFFSSTCRHLVRPAPFIEDAFIFSLYGFGFFIKNQVHQSDGERKQRGIEDGEGNRGFRIRCREGQERWLNGHENEWKSATDGGEEVGSSYRTRQRPEIREARKKQ